MVGDGDVVSIRGEFSASKIQAALSGHQIKILTVSENSVTLSLKENGFGIGQLVQMMTDAGLSIADISIQKPSLESVFLKLTGRELRD